MIFMLYLLIPSFCDLQQRMRQVLLAIVCGVLDLTASHSHIQLSSKVCCILFIVMILLLSQMRYATEVLQKLHSPVRAF